MRRYHAVGWAAVWALAGVNMARAQRPGDWMTGANDPQRSSWVRTDAKISPESMLQPGFDFVWKLKPENTARQLNTLMPPALLDFYIGYRGFRALGFFGGSADRVIAIDTELGRLEWENNYAASGRATGGTMTCPEGMTAAVTRPTNTAYPPVPTGRGPGRGTPAKSGVGSPYAGAVTIKPAAPPAPAPQTSAAAKPAAPVINPYAPKVQWALALTGDGKLHSLWVSNGNEPKPALPFLRPGAHAVGLMAYDDQAYVATTNGCGGVPNGVWAINLASGKVSHWKSGGSGVAGTVGPAAGPDGTLYVSGGGGELTALAAKTLQPLASYKTGGAEFSSSPVVFEYKNKNLIAVATKEGRLLLLDAASLGGGRPIDQTPPFSSPDFEIGSVTSWQDPTGTRWILAAAGGAVAGGAGFETANGEVKNGAIAAWKVVEVQGATVLQPAWISRDFVSPLPPIVVNGVVFAVSSGEFRSSDTKLTAAERAQQSTNAVLYALDSATGKELWNSGKTITSFVHSGGLAAGGTRVYVGTYDGAEYAFGFPIEH